MGEPTKDEAVVRPVTNEKPSRWWIAYHLWGGLCLKTYLDVSGLSKLLLGISLGIPSGSAEFALNAGKLAGLFTASAILIGYLLSESLVRVIESRAMTSKGKLALKILLPIGYFVGFTLLAMATDPLISSTN